MSQRCAGWGWGLGRLVLRHRYSLLGHHLAVPCDKFRLLSSSHRQDFLGVCACGAGWGGGGAMRRAGARVECACTYWPVLARRKAAAWASEGTATFRVWPWASAPLGAHVCGRGYRGRRRGTGQLGNAGGGAWSCVAGGRAAGQAASAKLRPGEAEAGTAPCDRLRRAVAVPVDSVSSSTTRSEAAHRARVGLRVGEDAGRLRRRAARGGRLQVVGQRLEA